MNISLPYRIVRPCLEGRPFWVTPNTMAAAGDFISSEDAARAMAALLLVPPLHHDAYNLASGWLIGVREMLETFRFWAPGFCYEVTGERQAEANIDPAHREGRWSAYDITRCHRYPRLVIRIRPPKLARSWIKREILGVGLVERGRRQENRRIGTSAELVTPLLLRAWGS
jgi:hypothetical protein